MWYPVIPIVIAGGILTVFRVMHFRDPRHFRDITTAADIPMVDLNVDQGNSVFETVQFSSGKRRRPFLHKIGCLHFPLLFWPCLDEKTDLPWNVYLATAAQFAAGLLLLSGFFTRVGGFLGIATMLPATYATIKLASLTLETQLEP